MPMEEAINMENGTSQVEAQSPLPEPRHPDEWWHVEFWTRMYPGPPRARRRYIVPIVLALLFMWQVWASRPITDRFYKNGRAVSGTEFGGQMGDVNSVQP